MMTSQHFPLLWLSVYTKGQVWFPSACSQQAKQNHVLNGIFRETANPVGIVRCTQRVFSVRP